MIGSVLCELAADRAVSQRSSLPHTPIYGNTAALLFVPNVAPGSRSGAGLGSMPPSAGVPGNPDPVGEYHRDVVRRSHGRLFNAADYL
jgi:hypothetical protein